MNLLPEYGTGALTESDGIATQENYQTIMTAMITMRDGDGRQ